MRSSSTTKLNYPEDVAIQVVETEALLDDYVSDLDDASDVEVVVDNTDGSETEVEDAVPPRAQKLRHRNFLYQDICLLAT